MSAPLILLPITILGAVAGAKQLRVSLRNDSAFWLGQYATWGPFDRRGQPIRFWLSVAWSFALLAGGILATFYVLDENI